MEDALKWVAANQRPALLKKLCDISEVSPAAYAVRTAAPAAAAKPAP